MAGRRRKPPRGAGAREGQTLTSHDIGSEGTDPDTGQHLAEITTAVQGEYPEEYEEYPDSWKAAYDACAKHGNTVKACVNWAGDHMSDYEGLDDGTEDEKDARIAELEQKLAEAQEASAS